MGQRTSCYSACGCFMLNNFDELIVLDSDGVTNLNAATPYGAGGNLAGLVFTSTGSTITVGVTSDGSVISCTSNPWDFDVSCVDTSALPNCNATLTAPLNGAGDVMENDDLNWSPATIFVTGYFVSIGTTPGGTDIADNVDVGNVTTYDPGTLPFDTTIFVTITPYNTNGSATGCTEESFTTRPDPNQILDCSIEKAETKIIPVLNFEVPTALHDVDSSILDPRDTYTDKTEWERKAKDLAARYIKNFEQYTTTEDGKRLISAGPQLK